MDKNKEIIKSYGMQVAIVILVWLSTILSIRFIEGKTALIIACVWIVITIPCYFLTKKFKKLYHVYPYLNGLVAGIALSVYYSMKDVRLYNPLLGIAVTIILMLISYGLISVTKKYNVIYIINMVLGSVGLVGMTYIWVTQDASLGSHMFFTLLIFLAFYITLFIMRKKDYHAHNLVHIASLVMYAWIFLVVLLIISEGDILDFSDFGGHSRSKKRTV